MIVRIILFAVAFHMAFSAVRVTASLDTLAHGYGATTVGLMVSLLALLPTFAAMPFGRLIDRVGPRKPLLAAGALLALGTALPAVFPTANYGLVPLAFGCADPDSADVRIEIVKRYTDRPAADEPPARTVVKEPTKWELLAERMAADMKANGFTDAEIEKTKASIISQ